MNVPEEIEVRRNFKMELRDCRGQLTKWFGSYGFIKYENRDVFVHLKNYNGFIPEVGQLVKFDFGLAPGDKPPMAVNVRVVKSALAVTAEQQIKNRLELNGRGGAR